MKTAKKNVVVLLLLKTFIAINILPIIIMTHLMVWGLDGITHQQWGGAWMTLVLGVVGVFVHQIVAEKRWQP
ncbi:hypothetical protein ACPESL_01310 [Psychrobacter pocilloporae]|uniref:hypothetical protein n=1 Tax=Psychrobacter pocilloporae TaxID=1775882 RepID=UPI003C2B862F